MSTVFTVYTEVKVIKEFFLWFNDWFDYRWFNSDLTITMIDKLKYLDGNFFESLFVQFYTIKTHSFIKHNLKECQYSIRLIAKQIHAQIVYL